MIKAVLFDFDDTLVKTKTVRYEALKEAGKKFYNLDFTDELIDAHWGKAFNPFMTDLFKNIENVETITANYKSILHKYPNKPFTGTNDVLEKLFPKYVLGIISSNIPDLITRGMLSTKLNPELFYFIQTSLDTDIHKPNPEVFLPTIEKLKSKNIKRSEIIYVGDAIDDYEASINSGIHFVAISDRTVDEVTFKKKKIPYIKLIKELYPYIQKFN